MSTVDVAAVVYPDNLAALGVCRALGAHGVPVMVLASDHMAPGQYSRYARRVTCPPREPLEPFVDFLTAFGKAQTERPVLYLTDDATIVALQPYRARLDTCYRLTVPAWPILETVLYKDRLYAALEGIVPLPRTRRVLEEADLAAAAMTVGFPAVVKPVLRWLPPRAGRAPAAFEKSFRTKALRARDPRELRAAYLAARQHGFTEMLVQEEIPGPVSALYGVGLYATADAVVATFTSQKLGQEPPDFGDGLIVRAAHTPGLATLAVRAVRHLGFHGIADMEFKWDARDGRHKLLDVNPRPWLWINLPTACGVNLVLAAYLDAIGRPIDPAAFVQRDWDTRWVSIRGLFVCAVRALAGRRAAGTLGAFVRQVRGRRIGPLWNRQDVLLRMFVNPGYWRETLAHASRELRQLRPVHQES